jgi:transcriptional regulator with XRE-family HTH domain
MEWNDIDKFKKICEILKKEKNYTDKIIAAEMGISDVHVNNILKDKILKIRASTLGKIQDFNKKHITDLEYAGLSNDNTKSVSEWAKTFLETEKAKNGIKIEMTMKEMHDKAREEREKKLLSKIFPGLDAGRIVFVSNKESDCISKTIALEIELRIRLME